MSTADAAATTDQAVPHPPLTPDRVYRLWAIIDAAQRGVRVRRLFDEERVLEAVARQIVADPETYAPPGADTDARDCLLRVTLHGGLGSDYCWLVRDLIEELGEEFHVDTP